MTQRTEDSARERPASGGRIATDAAAAAQVRAFTPLDRLLRGTARNQPLHQRPGHGARVACPCPVQPALPGAGEEEQRRGDHVQGDGHPGHVRERGDLQGLEADDAFPNRDPRVRQHRRALPAASGERRHGQRGAARQGGAVVADAAVRFRADDPVRRPALLAVPAGRQLAQRARLVRTVTCPPL